MFGYICKEKTVFIYGKIIQKSSQMIKNTVLTIEISSKDYWLAFFNIQVSRSHSRGDIDFSEEHYQLLPVPKSNLFVVVEDQRYLNNQETCCSVGYIQKIALYM